MFYLQVTKLQPPNYQNKSKFYTVLKCIPVLAETTESMEPITRSVSYVYFVLHNPITITSLSVPTTLGSADDHVNHKNIIFSVVVG